MPIRVVTGPTTEPVTVDEAREYLRVDHDADDGLLGTLISAARQDAEQLAARSFISRTNDLLLDAWPTDNVIRLPYPPLVSVTSITYYDEDNVAQTMPAADYVAITDTTPGLITLARNASWPTASLRPVSPIRVRYVAGYGTADDVPERYRMLILALVAIAYENRDSVTASPVDNADRQREFVAAAFKQDWGWAE